MQIGSLPGFKALPQPSRWQEASIAGTVTPPPFGSFYDSLPTNQAPAKRCAAPSPYTFAGTDALCLRRRVNSLAHVLRLREPGRIDLLRLIGDFKALVFDGAGYVVLGPGAGKGQ